MSDFEAVSACGLVARSCDGAAELVLSLQKAAVSETSVLKWKMTRTAIWPLPWFCFLQFPWLQNEHRIQKNLKSEDAYMRLLLCLLNLVLVKQWCSCLTNEDWELLPHGFAGTVVFIGAGEENLTESPVWDSGGASWNFRSVTLLSWWTQLFFFFPFIPDHEESKSLFCL